jgi:hypothetical protein
VNDDARSSKFINQRVKQKSFLGSNFFTTTICSGVRNIFTQNIVYEKKAYFFLDKHPPHTYTFVYWWWKVEKGGGRC